MVLGLSALVVPAFLASADEDERTFGIEIGEPAPEAIVEDVEGEAVELVGIYEQGPTVLVFYRGGWCPYCNKQLAVWQEYVGDVESAGAQLVMITPEKPEYIEKTTEEGEYGFTIYCDPEFAAADAFNLRFSLSDEIKAKYKDYGIDLGTHNVNGQWELPVPATFVISADGEIVWSHVDEDYTVRADPKDVLAALRELD